MGTIKISFSLPNMGFLNKLLVKSGIGNESGQSSNRHKTRKRIESSTKLSSRKSSNESLISRKPSSTGGSQKLQSQLLPSIPNENQSVSATQIVISETDELRLIRDNPGRNRPRTSRIPRLNSIVEDKFNEEIHRIANSEPVKPADKLSRNDRKRNLTVTLKKLSLDDQILQNPQIFTEETYLNKKQLLTLMEKSEINDRQFENYVKDHKKQINTGIMGKTEKAMGTINCNFITNIGRLRNIYEMEDVGELDYVENRINIIAGRGKSSRGDLFPKSDGKSQYPMPGMDSSARLGGLWGQSKAAFNLLSEDEMVKGINAIKKSMTSADGK